MNAFNEIWVTVQEALQKGHDFSEETYNLWFKDLSLEMLTDKEAFITVKSKFKHDIINQRYLSVISEELDRILGFHVDIVLICLEDLNCSLEAKIASLTGKAAPEVISPEEKFFTPSENVSIGDDYTSAFTFDNFIVGNTNKYAHAACLAVATHPVQNYNNPLFLYGPSGLGKTHLLYAIANEFKKNNPEKTIMYVRGEDFGNQFVTYLSQNKPMHQFRDKYRSADLLLIDDVQFFAGKNVIQEELFHTFNALYESNRQIVLSSDRPPKEIKTLEDRLTSRFEGGLTVDVQPPDLELRIAILKRKADDLQITIPNDVIVYLAEQIRNNIRQLEGAIKKLNVRSFVDGKPIDIEAASKTLQDLFSSEQPITVTIDKIFDTVSKKYNIPVDEIKGKKQTKEVSMARHISVYLLREIPGLTLEEIGKVFDKHHTTIMSSISKINDMMKNDANLDFEVKELIKEIKSN